VAEIIQLNNPDVLLINEFDYLESNPLQAVELFQQNYLSISQNGATPVEYPYAYIAPSNTGIPSGFDLNNDGTVGGGNDAFGFGFFPGQFGMLLLSKYPIDTPNVRTFQEFLWKDMPNSLLPTISTPGSGTPWYSPEEQEVLRLSSKSHWDVPILIDGETVHVLVSHPTPPVFDGDEDRNGKRNHDEIRFWSDYVTPEIGDYIYDDDGNLGGLAAGSSFVIMGDQNADPFDGDSFDNAILQLLQNPYINTNSIPSSLGGVEQASLQGGANDNHSGNPAFDTADFADGSPGNLRVDYVLPSADLQITNSAVFWPEASDPNFASVGTFPFPSSDHRLVFTDVEVGEINPFVNGVASGDTTQTSTVLWTRSILPGAVTFEYSTDANFTTIVGTETANVTDINVPVKVNIDGLIPNTQYYYRVTDVNGISSDGKFSTAASLGQQTGLKFGVSGDWRGDLAPYPAVSNADEADLKFFLEFGDTIYADYGSPVVLNPDGTEKQQAVTLDEFRAKQAEVYGQRYGLNTLGDIRASTSILATIDDHEVVDNFGGGEDLATANADIQALFGANSGLQNDSPLYENGLQAFQEYNPITDQFYGETGDEVTAGERKLYRFNTYGSDAATFVLDARSFRDPALPDVVDTTDATEVANFLAASFDPNRTMLGEVQLEDLKTDLLEAENNGITWKFIMMPQPVQNFGLAIAADRFEGYAAERTELFQFINDNNIENVVFVTADFHGTVVNNLTYQVEPFAEQIPISAFEIITGSVAFDPPFGPTVGEFLTPEQQAFYNALPVANDADSIIDDKDDFIKSVIDAGLSPLGYDPVGLNNNLAIADGLIDATLLQGDYITTHTYGWTEFDIDPITQRLTVTTYGVEPYNREELEANTEEVINRQPQIVSQFEVNPTLLIAESNLIVGSPEADILIGGIDFDAVNDIVFTGAGTDEVDTPLGGILAGNNRIFTGSNADIIFAADGDRAFGGSGNDELDATDATSYRISGGAGNDTFFLGTDGRALGGEGNDIFNVLEGGGNIIAGGEGADEFWILSDNPNTLNTPNMITDFEIGVDILGIRNQGADFSFDDLTLGGNDIMIGSQTIATLNGVNTSNLTAADFAFA
ncbi:MAG: phytase, partial [Sphaerospermopsis sp. SIO1G2]|nr:phytase [Sphaerospermopsis sp. SIO1G2]